MIKREVIMVYTIIYYILTSFKNQSHYLLMHFIHYRLYMVYKQYKIYTRRLSCYVFYVKDKFLNSKIIFIYLRKYSGDTVLKVLNKYYIRN